ncbi:MAG: S-layer homology domain-containing protein [Tissierellia bacterium]|nr:S-layer homology domain-containing protein [Tissierellia bacterium]
MKKLLIFIILLISIFSMTTAYSSTIEFSDIKGDLAEEAVNLLSSYEIINGYPNNMFKPNNTVTRAEMAKIITVAAGLNEYSKNMTSTYKDMHDHWAEEYVELANAINIVKGISADEYGPDNKIKFNEALTMIVRLIGYSDEALEGQWPSNYYEKAKELNLFENINSNSEYASRRDISIMLYNALNCNLVKVKENNSILKTDKILLSLVGTMKTEVIGLDRLKLNDSFNYTDYLFNKWDVYYNNDGKVVYITNPRYREFSGTVTSLLSTRVLFVTDDPGNVRAFKLTDIPIVFNGALGNFNSLENAKIKVVYDTDTYDGSVIGVIGYKVTDEVLMSKSDLYTNGGKTIANKNLPSLSSQINFNKIYVYGDATSLEEIRENDVVYFYETDEYNSKKSTLSLEVVRNHIQGTVTKVENINGSLIYTVNNQEYNPSKNFVFTENASINDCVKFILDKNNNLVKLFITKFGKPPSTYGIVLNATSGTNGLATVKILDEYGNTKNYTLAGNSSVITYVSHSSSEQYINSLKKNDIIKFDPVKQGSIKIIDYMPAQYIANSFNESTKYIGNTYKVTNNSFIVYETNGKYKLLKPYELDSYLVGKAYITSGHADVLYLTSGLKIKEEVITENNFSIDQPNSFNGTIYDIIKSTKNIDNKTIQVQFFNKSGSYYVSSSSATGKTISSKLNSYVKVVVSDDKITSITKVTPETDKIKISAIYSNQLQIDGITYMEYSSNVKVYICTINSLGNIYSVKSGSKQDLVPGSKAQLYDIYGSFDGIVDVILIFN